MHCACLIKGAIDEVVTRGFYGALPLSYAPMFLKESWGGGTRTHDIRLLKHVLRIGSRSCALVLFLFLLQCLPHLLPHTAAVVRIEPDQLLLSCVDNVDASPGTFDVNEGQADGDDFVGLTRVTRLVRDPNPFVGRQSGARAAP